MDRSKCIVLEPYSFLNPNRISVTNPWRNTHGPGHYYRKCTDPDLKFDRELINNFESIDYIDYKLYSENLSVIWPRLVLDKILSNTQNKILHVSIDDYLCRYPESLVQTLERLGYSGTLAIDIFDYGALRFSNNIIKRYANMFKPMNLVRCEYNYYIDSLTSFKIDLLSDDLVPCTYSSLVVKNFE